MSELACASVGLLSTLLVCLDARPADACVTPPVPPFQLSDFQEGKPDENGLIDGEPNANQLRVAEPLILYACAGCYDEFDLKLEDETTFDHPVHLEHLRPGEFHRVVPAAPLQPGSYTLTLTATQRTDTLVQTYVFRVVQEPEPIVADLVSTVRQRWGSVSAGSSFACLDARSSACRDPGVSTQARPYVLVTAGFEQPVTPEQNQAFLARLLPIADSTWLDSMPWRRVWYPLALEFREPVPEYCGVVQTLRLSDGAVMTREPTCFRFTPEELAPYPAKFQTCRMNDRSAYARAWCLDNRAACSEQTDLAGACEDYADVCGVYLGRRADDEGVCGP